MSRRFSNLGLSPWHFTDFYIIFFLTIYTDWADIFLISQPNTTSYEINSKQTYVDGVYTTSMMRVTMMEVFLKRSATAPRTGTMRSQRTLTVSSAV